MSVLGIVGVFRLCTVAEIVLCNKICATDIAVSFIELVVDNVCNDLLATVPDMIYRLTSYEDSGAKLVLESCFVPDFKFLFISFYINFLTSNIEFTII